jgi:hypothetical protein
VTIQGVQTWNLVDDGFGTVTINGGGTTTSPSITGLTELNFNGNGGGTLNLGTALLPIDKPGDLANGFTLGVSNALGGIGHHIDIAFASGVLTGTETITVNAFSVGNVADNDLDNAYGIAAGGTGPQKQGFLTWDLNSTGATLGTVNDIALGGEDNSTATTLNITDDGSTTIVYASSASGSKVTDWQNLATINASGTTGELTIIGGETVAGTNGAGLLAADTTAINTVVGGSGADVFDLTASTWSVTQVAGVSISGGGNTTGQNSLFDPNDVVPSQDLGTVVELNSNEINSISTVAANAFANWSGVPTLYDVGSGSGLGLVGGLINLADFPGTTTVTLANNRSGNFVQQGSDLKVTNAPDGLTFNFQDANQQGHNFTIFGASGNPAGDTVTVNYGTGYNYTADSTGVWVGGNFDHTDINVFSGFQNSGDQGFYTGGLLAASTFGGTETLNLETSVNLNVASTLTADVIGTTSLSLFGGTPFDPSSGTLDLSAISHSPTIAIGVTNAFDIIDTSGGAFTMDAPDDDISIVGLLGPTLTLGSR